MSRAHRALAIGPRCWFVKGEWPSPVWHQAARSDRQRTLRTAPMDRSGISRFDVLPPAANPLAGHLEHAVYSRTNREAEDSR